MPTINRDRPERPTYKAVQKRVGHINREEQKFVTFSRWDLDGIDGVGKRPFSSEIKRSCRRRRRRCHRLLPASSTKEEIAPSTCRHIFLFSVFFSFFFFSFPLASPKTSNRTELSLI